MNKFKVGDICVIHSISSSNPHAKFNGEEVSVKGVPGSNQYFPECYYVSGRIDVDLPEGKLAWMVEECHLKLREDGSKLESDLSRQQLNTKVNWEDCAWKPETIKQ